MIQLCVAMALLLAPAVAQAQATKPAPLSIYAADSLREALTEVIKSYETTSAQKINLKFGASHELTKELVAGTEANLFISDHEDEIKRLGQHNKSLKGTRATMLSNTLAVVAHAGSTWTLSSAAQLADLSFRTLALPDPAIASLGKYTQTCLASLPKGQGTVWDSLQKRVKPTLDPRKAVEVDKNTLGILYGTEAKKAKNVKVLFDIPAEECKTYYSLVMLQAKNHGPQVLDLFNYLQSKQAKEVFARYGFGTPRPSEGRGRPGPARKDPKPGQAPTAKKPGSKTSH